MTYLLCLDSWKLRWNKLKANEFVQCNHKPKLQWKQCPDKSAVPTGYLAHGEWELASFLTFYTVIPFAVESDTCRKTYSIANVFIYSSRVQSSVVGQWKGEGRARHRNLRGYTCFRWNIHKCSLINTFSLHLFELDWMPFNRMSPNFAPPFKDALHLNHH